MAASLRCRFVIRLDRLRPVRGELELRMPALMAAAACNDDSEGECGDGWWSVVVMVERARVGDGGRELRSGMILFLFVCSGNCLVPAPPFKPRHDMSLHTLSHDGRISCLPLNHQRVSLAMPLFSSRPDHKHINHLGQLSILLPSSSKLRTLGSFARYRHQVA